MDSDAGGSAAGSSGSSSSTGPSSSNQQPSQPTQAGQSDQMAAAIQQQLLLAAAVLFSLLLILTLLFGQEASTFNLKLTKIDDFGYSSASVCTGALHVHNFSFLKADDGAASADPVLLYRMDTDFIFKRITSILAN